MGSCSYVRLAKALAPVFDLTLAIDGAHPEPLPFGVVGIFNVELRQSRRLATRKRRVEAPELVDQHAHRPAVGHDMVQADHEKVVVFLQRQQCDTHKRPGFEIEGQRCFLARQLARLLFAIGPLKVTCRTSTGYGSSTICSASLPSCRKTVRSALCRSTSLSKACCSAFPSSLPRTRTAAEML